MKRKATRDVTFSYDLAVPISRHKDPPDTEWNIIEKGSEKVAKIMRTYTMYISVSRIRSALLDIKEYIFKTSLSESVLLRTEGFHIYLKREFDQNMFSVQARGIIYTFLQLSDEQRRKGVIAISTGHFAHTLCYLGKLFGIPVTMVMPESANKNIDKCRTFSATVIVGGNDMIEIHKVALYLAMTEGLFYLDRNDHPNMIIGQATLGIEIFEQSTEFDAVILPTTIDGCGLTAGLAMAIRGWNSNIKIIEVQTADQDPSIFNVRKKTFQEDELNIPIERSVAYVHAKGIQNYLFDWVIKVPESSVRIAADFLLDKENISDYYGAIGLAGIQSGFLNSFLKEKRVLIPLFGRMDSSMSFTSNESSLPHAGPSTSFF